MTTKPTRDEIIDAAHFQATPAPAIDLDLIDHVTPTTAARIVNDLYGTFQRLDDLEYLAMITAYGMITWTENELAIHVAALDPKPRHMIAHQMLKIR